MRPLPLLAVGVAVTALLGCATEAPPPSPAQAADAEPCVNRTSRLGSMIVRAEPCVASTPESRAEARRRAEEMRTQQERTSAPRSTGGGQ